MKLQRRLQRRNNTCTRSPIQNTKQHGYLTSNVKWYDRVLAQQKDNRQENKEEKDAEMATWKEL